MALEKAITSGKEHRKPYYGSKIFDPSCRNNKGCPACISNRTISVKKAKMKAQYQEKEEA